MNRKPTDAKEANVIAKKANKIALIAIFITIVATLITAWFIWDSKNRERQRDSTQFRPNLKVIGKPIVVSYSIQSERFSIRDVLSNYSSNPSNVTATLSVKIKIRCTNIGNSIAHLFAIARMDTASGVEALRPKLLNREEFKNESNSEYYNLGDLSPADTISIEREFNIQSFENNMFTLHYLFLYANETNALFDSYYLARYSTGSLNVVPYQVTLPDGTPGFTLNVSRSELNSFLTFVDDHPFSTQVYSDEDASRMIEYLNSLSRR